MENRFLYFFKYPHLEEELFKGEYRALFNHENQANYLFSNIRVDIDKSVYIKDVVRLIAEAPSMDEVLKMLEAKKLEYRNFKVIYLKNDQTHVKYQETLDICARISKTIAGNVRVSNPENTIAVTFIEGKYVVGEVDHGDESWKRFLNKPYTFCNALDLRMCRTLINLAVGTSDSITVVDPCCGMGSVVLEGLGLGVDIIGFDISRSNSYRARLNLENYGYDGQLVKKSAIEDLEIKKDVAIIDLPYNLYTPITREQQESIIVNGLRIAEKLVLVVHEEYEELFEKHNFEIIRKMIVRKTDNGKFKRIVYILKR